MAIINKPDDAVSELTEFRTLNSKRFDLGNGFHRLIHSIGRIHFQDDDGSLKDIDTTLGIDAVTGEIIADQLPFRFRLLKNGIGYIFQSRSGGTIRVELRRVGATVIDTNAVFTATRTRNQVTFANVATDTDIIIKVNQNGIQIFRQLKSAVAAKAWRWAVTYGTAGQSKISATMQGQDANKRDLAGLTLANGAPMDNGNGTFSYISNESWDGSVVTVDPVTRIKTQTTDPQYPVLIDPDITDFISTNNDDGHSTTASVWNTTQFWMGKAYGGKFAWGGLRFQSLAISQGATISLANLKVNPLLALFGGGSYASGTVFGLTSDNAGSFANSDGPKDRTKTSASTVLPAATGSVQQVVDVTAQVQEIVNRAGWVSGNAMAFDLEPDGGAGNAVTKFSDYFDFGSLSGSVLEITLAAAAVPTNPIISGIINNPVNF